MTSESGALATVVAHLNAMQAQGLIGSHAVGGAMAFVYWAEPFETKDLDVFTVLPLTAAGLIHLAPIWDYLVAAGATPEGQFIRVGRLLLDFVPASNALDEEAISEAVPVTVGENVTHVFTPEHAVAIALRTWRGKDREHIDRLIRTGRRPLDLARLHRILTAHGLED